MHNSNQQNHEHYPEEIDLVDVAAVVYRRKATLVLVVLCSVIVSFGYWFYSANKIQVSSVIKFGEISSTAVGELNTVPLTSVADASQLLRMVYLPELIRSIGLETGIQIRLKDIKTNYLKSSSILELYSDTNQIESQVLITIFDASLELLLKNHEEKLTVYTLRMRSLIDNQKAKVLLLKQIATAEDPRTKMMEISLFESNIMALESTLATATKSVIIKSASVEEIDSKGPAIFIAGGFVVGLFLGCFLIFFLELYAKAKIRAAE